MTNEFVVKMQRSLVTDSLDIVMYEVTGRELYVVKPMPLVLERIEPNAPIAEPTLRLSRWMADPFLTAWADMLHKENVKPTIQSFIEGELTATKKHLADMRQLLLRKA